MKRRSPPGGFTLIELLVVISIIAILAGLSAAYVLRARQDGTVRAEELNLQSLVARLEACANELRDYPPSSLREIGVKCNSINEGIESLLAHLQTRKHGGPFLVDLEEDKRGNTDADLVAGKDLAVVKSRLDWNRATPQLFEYHDQWGNPYVYIHNRDYGKSFEIQGEDGEIRRVHAAKDPTGGYAAPTTFQLRSLGPDGKDENGEGDDVCSWKR